MAGTSMKRTDVHGLRLDLSDRQSALLLLDFIAVIPINVLKVV